MARKIKIEFRLGFTDRVRMRGLTPCPPCKHNDMTPFQPKTSATNVWITQQLNMGTPDAVSRYVSEFRTSVGDQKISFKELTTKVMT